MGFLSINLPACCASLSAACWVRVDMYVHPSVPFLTVNVHVRDHLCLLICACISMWMCVNLCFSVPLHVSYVNVGMFVRDRYIQSTDSIFVSVVCAPVCFLLFNCHFFPYTRGKGLRSISLHGAQVLRTLGAVNQ